MNKLPLGHDPEKYQWQKKSDCVFCMDEDGQIVFVISEPTTWREAMLRAFEAGMMEEADRHANYIELLETLCEEMLPEAFTPLDEGGVELLIRAKLMNLTKQDIQREWDAVQQQRELDWQQERKRIQARVDASWAEFEEQQD